MRQIRPCSIIFDLFDGSGAGRPTGNEEEFELKIPKGQSESVYRRTDNTMVNYIALLFRRNIVIKLKGHQ
jgi:hypothetical protein